MAGVWEIQEEERTYEATLDEKGNGPYTWKEDRIQTTEFVDRVLTGCCPALWLRRFAGKKSALEAGPTRFFTFLEARGCLQPLRARSNLYLNHFF
ncbi:MAG: hypothetical protein E2O41_02970 [Nitrospina sp.]|nr:MAG: hypothetical protein E2O41_02970 [Nitrospina sp.]